MPHVVIKGDIDLRRFFEEFEPIYKREDGIIFKVKDAFLNPQNTKLLLESIVVEEGIPQSFLVQIKKRSGESVTIKLYPQTDPEKTPGVKKLITFLFKHITQSIIWKNPCLFLV